jgi:hypothetical protein
MSAIGTWRTTQPHPRLSAIGVTADIAYQWGCKSDHRAVRCYPQFHRHRAYNSLGDGVGTLPPGFGLSHHIERSFLARVIVT